MKKETIREFFVKYISELRSSDKSETYKKNVRLTLIDFRDYLFEKHIEYADGIDDGVLNAYRERLEGKKLKSNTLESKMDIVGRFIRNSKGDNKIEKKKHEGVKFSQHKQLYLSENIELSSKLLRKVIEHPGKDMREYCDMLFLQRNKRGDYKKEKIIKLIIKIYSANGVLKKENDKIYPGLILDYHVKKTNYYDRIKEPALFF